MVVANTRARTRALSSVMAGVVVFGIAWVFSPWQIAGLCGWDATAATFAIWVWLEVGRMSSADTAAHATTEDDSRAESDLLLLGACVGSLIGVCFVLLKASQANGGARPVLVALALLSVSLSWVVVHTVFTLRYAHLFYTGGGGIDFPGTKTPGYGDFAYLSLTIGMTFQVSDTDVSSHDVRMTVLRHSLLAYLFGFAVIALTINVVAGLIG
jgi:uncharacterized membrane protein